MVEQSTKSSNNVVLDVMEFGDATPVYTWRKGGVNLDDNHFYLIVGSAFDPIDKSENGNVLIEVDPVTKITRFYNEAQLLNGFSFDANTLSGSSIKDGSITVNKLDPSIEFGKTAEKLKTARSIDGLLFDGSQSVTRFATCTTASSTKIKVVSWPKFEKVEGSCVIVKFTKKNTNASPTLNVNDTGASPIYENGKAYAGLDADHIYLFVYDGSRYNIIGHAKFDKLSQGVTEVNDEYPILVTDNKALVDGTDASVLGTSGVTLNPYTKTLTVPKIVSSLTSKTWIDANKNAVITNVLASGGSTPFLRYVEDSGVYTLTGKPEGMYVSYAKHANVNNSTPDVLVKLTDSSGNASFPSNVTAKKFVGNLEGLASKATADANGNAIASTYAKTSELTRVENNCKKELDTFKDSVEKTYAKKGEASGGGAVNVDEVVNTVLGTISGNYLNLSGGKLTGALQGTTAKFTSVEATTFTGSLSGNATSATKATNDSLGRKIDTTYALASALTATNNSLSTLSSQMENNYVTKSSFNTKITELTTRIDNLATSGGGGGASSSEIENLNTTLTTKINDLRSFVTSSYVDKSSFNSSISEVERQLTTLSGDLEELDEVVVAIYEDYATQTDLEGLADSIVEGFNSFNGTVAKNYVNYTDYNQLKAEIASSYVKKEDLGDVEVNIDLEEYLKKSDASNTYVKLSDYNALKAEVTALKNQLNDLRSYCDLTFMTKTEYEAQLQESISSF